MNNLPSILDLKNDFGATLTGQAFNEKYEELPLFCTKEQYDTLLSSPDTTKFLPVYVGLDVIWHTIPCDCNKDKSYLKINISKTLSCSVKIPKRGWGTSYDNTVKLQTNEVVSGKNMTGEEIYMEWYHPNITKDLNSKLLRQVSLQLFVNGSGIINTFDDDILVKFLSLYPESFRYVDKKRQTKDMVKTILPLDNDGCENYSPENIIPFLNVNIVDQELYYWMRNYFENNLYLNSFATCSVRHLDAKFQTKETVKYFVGYLIDMYQGNYINEFQIVVDDIDKLRCDLLDDNDLHIIAHFIIYSLSKYDRHRWQSNAFGELQQKISQINETKVRTMNFYQSPDPIVTSYDDYRL